MEITPSTLRTLAQGFNAAFIRGIEAAPSSYQQVAMTIPSTSDAENYGWLKTLPGMREWIGQRFINNLESETAQLKNKHFEHTIGVNADAILDDKIGIYSNVFAMQGEIAGGHPDELVWGLLPNGASVKGFDGKNFFAENHIGYTEKGKETAWRNVQAGTGKGWYLLDLSRAFMKPLIFQSRQAVRFISKNRAEDDNVFMNNEYLFGADARYNAGFGFYQLAYASFEDLTAENFAAARVALGTQRRPDGQPLAVRGTHLVVGPSNEQAALEILNKEFINGGDTNIWFKSAQLVVSPFLG